MYFYVTKAFQVHKHVLTTRHGAIESGACRLPSATYAYKYPVALGNIDSLGGIKFKGNLCEHVLQIDCGKGKLNITVINSNLGGGLDLYSSSWSKATNNLPPGQQYCSVQLTSLNSLTSNNPKCYHATDETKNQYYRSVGLLNTGGKLVIKATFKGKNGANNGQDFYYSFSDPGTETDKVTFFFNDGTVYSVPLGDCISNPKYQIWQ